MCGDGFVVFSFLVFHESYKKGEMFNYLAIKSKPYALSYNCDLTAQHDFFVLWAE